MKKLTFLIAATLVAIYSGPSFANGAACPLNKGKHAQTAKPSQTVNRVLAALDFKKAEPRQSYSTSKKRKVR